MSLKRPHNKSRTGCKQCKVRRIKCDETPPCCQNCAKKGLECEYKDYKDAFESIRLLTPGTFAAPGPSASSNSRQGPSEPEPEWADSPTAAAQQERPHSRAANSSRGQLPDGTFTVEDLGLIHAFTLLTSQTLPVIDVGDHRQVWQWEVPRVATFHPFMMHAMLGITMAHKHAYDGKSDHEALNKVRQHYSKALTLFPREVGNLRDQADAVLCFSIMIVVLTLYLDNQKGPEEDDPVKHFGHMLHLIHNAINVIDMLDEPIRGTKLCPLMAHVWNKEPHALDPDLRDSLEHLKELTNEYRNSSAFQADESMALADACAKLSTFFSFLEPGAASWLYFLTLPVTLDPGFSLLLERQNPIALCILAHWCVPMWHAPVMWYAEDLPQKLIRKISMQLQGSIWHEGLAWPLRETVHREGGVQAGSLPVS